jgi:hypothetical protein
METTVAGTAQASPDSLSTPAERRCITNSGAKLRLSLQFTKQTSVFFYMPTPFVSFMKTRKMFRLF